MNEFAEDATVGTQKMSASLPTLRRRACSSLSLVAHSKQEEAVYVRMRYVVCECLQTLFLSTPYSICNAGPSCWLVLTSLLANSENLIKILGPQHTEFGY